jgi:hypothetical protein
MTEEEALERAWSVVREAGLEQEIVRLKTIRLSTAAEVREVLEVDEPDLADTWYVSFLLKLDAGVVYQHPDCILVTDDDGTTKEPSYLLPRSSASTMASTS